MLKSLTNVITQLAITASILLVVLLIAVNQLASSGALSALSQMGIPISVGDMLFHPDKALDSITNSAMNNINIQ